MTVWSNLRLVLVIPLLLWSLLAVLQAPHGVLWKPAVVATEAGHVLAVLCALLLLGGWGSRRAAVAFGCAAVATVLFASPAVRGAAYARSAGPTLEAFGPRPAPGPEQSAEFVVASYVGAAGQEQPLRLYGARPRDVPAPLVVVVHGGSWKSGDESQLPGINERLAAQGYVVAAISYRLAPAHRFPSPVDDIPAAVADLRSRATEYGIDPERVVLLGRSAGGQIALAAGYRGADPGIVGVVSLYAPTDLVWSWAHPANPWILDTFGSLTGYLGGGPDDHPAAYAAASPLGHVGPQTPPTLLLHGQRDELVSHQHAVRLAGALSDAGVPHIFLSLPWATHGCDASLGGPAGRLYVDALDRFLHRVAGPGATAR